MCRGVCICVLYPIRKLVRCVRVLLRITHRQVFGNKQKRNKQNPWPECVNDLYRSSDRRMSAKLVPTFADRGCHVASVTDPYGRILGFLDRQKEQ
jgi:hypothetical protein